jgi:hypothetical protein
MAAKGGPRILRGYAPSSPVVQLLLPFLNRSTAALDGFQLP